MQYTTRVELHYATDDDYESLHDAMAREGFSRQITSNDGVTYHLPTAEYNYEGNRSRSQVLDAFAPHPLPRGSSHSLRR